MTKTSTHRAVRAGIVLSSFGCLAGLALGQDLLADGGPLSAMPGAHQTGGDLIWAVPEGASAGVSSYSSLAYRLAEGFELTAAATIDSVVVYGYQQGAIAGSTIDFMGVELWSGRPGEAGSRVVAGDITQNMLASAEHTNAYVAMFGVDFPIDRAVYALSADNLGWSVDAGEYWLAWTLNGSLDGGPYTPYLGDDTEPVIGDAMQRVFGAWRPARNSSEGGVQVSLPFAVYGSTSCAADLDGDGALTIFDFLAFQNAYMAGDMVADCDSDGELSVLDFTCFQTAFAGGCG
jgi:hypothetical protein